MPRLGIALFLLLISGALVFFFVLPQWEAAGALRAEVMQREMIAQELADLAQKRDELVAQYNAIPESDLQKLQDLAPVGRQSAKALTDFEALASLYRVSLDQVEFSSSETESAIAGGKAVSRIFTPMPVTLNIRGDYPSVRGFLGALEKSLRIFDVTDINLSGGQDSGALSLSLHGKIYYQP